jgi:hypothetical protein
VQCGAPGEHRNSLLPNTQMLEKKISAKPEVRKIIMSHNLLIKVIK